MTPLQNIIFFLAIASVYAGPLGPDHPEDQHLDKRAVCYYDCQYDLGFCDRKFAKIDVAFGNPYTCVVGYQCCYGNLVSGCIPNGFLCCDMGTWLGWCPVGTTCGTLNGYPACINSSGKTVAAETASAVETSTSEPTGTGTGTPSPGPSSSQDSGLSKGAIIAISVSVSCSILGLILGLWIKYHFSKKAAKRGQVS